MKISIKDRSDGATDEVVELSLYRGIDLVDPGHEEVCLEVSMSNGDTEFIYVSRRELAAALDALAAS